MRSPPLFAWRMYALASVALLVALPVWGDSVFTKKNAMALVELDVSGHEAVALAILASPGKSAAAENAVRAAGGRVRYRFGPADFLSVVLPGKSVRSFLEQPFIDAAGVDLHDAQYRYRSLMPDMLATTASGARDPVDRYDGSTRRDWPPPLSAYPLEHAYDVLRALEADAFRKEGTGHDGRGVVIAHVETFADMLLPQLQDALDQSGRRVPKIVDILNHRDVKPSLAAEATRDDWQWVKLAHAETASNGTLTIAGRRYKTPAYRGVYRSGTLHIPTYVLSPINLPGHGDTRAGSADNTSMLRDYLTHRSMPFQVLWSESARKLWIDSDDDGDFSDETGVTEYRLSHQVGVLGVDDPATARRESRGYGVERDGDYVSIDLDCNLHSTMVAGVAAATRGAEGFGEGIAPGAQLISINHGTTFSSFGWALIQAFADRRSDVVLIEATFPTQGEDHLKDGRSVLGVLMSRLTRLYPKPSFWTANNEPSMSSIVDPSVAPETISVGAYDTAESIHVHFGMKLPWQDALHSIGSEGPAGNGASKPDLLAPSMMIGLRDGYLASDSLNTLPGLYQLPGHYMVSGGTSAATPIATGATALLIGAAKQAGLPHDAASIKRALTGSARYLANAGSYQQGAGVIRVGAAWEQLVAQSKVKSLSIEVSATVRTANSHLLQQPHRGPGLFEREGWSAGDRGVRRVTFIRKNGPSGTLRFKTRWNGNTDGTFAVADEVGLPLDTAVEIEIAIAPKNEGVHSATLQLHHESQPGPAVSVPVTIVVPYELDAKHGFTRDVEVKLRRLGRHAVFVRVPQDAQALTFESTNTSKDSFIRFHDPTGREQGFALERNPVTGRAFETVPTPMPGVWGVFLADGTGQREFFRANPDFVTDATDDAPPPAKIGIRMSVAGVTVAAGDTPLANSEVRDVTIANSLAALSRAQLVSQIGYVRTVEGRLARGERKELEIVVPAASDLLLADLRPVDTHPLDADLYLFDCTQGACVLVRTARDYRSGGRVFVESPRAGRWKIVLDAGAAHETDTRYVYRDFYTARDSGTVSVIDPPLDHATGAQWKAQIKPWLLLTPTTRDDRQRSAVLYVQDERRTSQLKPETMQEMFACPTYPLCGMERREVAPLGLTVVPFE